MCYSFTVHRGSGTVYAPHRRRNVCFWSLCAHTRAHMAIEGESEQIYISQGSFLNGGRGTAEGVYKINQGCLWKEMWLLSTSGGPRGWGGGSGGVKWLYWYYINNPWLGCLLNLTGFWQSNRTFMLLAVSCRRLITNPFGLYLVSSAQQADTHTAWRQKGVTLSKLKGGWCRFFSFQEDRVKCHSCHTCVVGLKNKNIMF